MLRERETEEKRFRAKVLATENARLANGRLEKKYGFFRNVEVGLWEHNMEDRARNTGHCEPDI